MSWIKLHREVLDSNVFAHPTTFKIWCWLLIKANHKQKFVSMQTGRGFTEISVERGQFIFGRHKAETVLDIDGSTIYKHIQKLQDWGNIKIESNNQYSVITICKYDEYQTGDGEDEQPSSNQVTTKEQPSSSEVTQTRNPKNDKECKEVIQYLNIKTGKQYRLDTGSIIRLITARINEGNSFEDFKAVIDTKFAEWYLDEKMKKYLRPETLFGTKFETYRNEAGLNVGAKVEIKCPEGFDSFSWNQMSEQDKVKYLEKI